MRTRPLAGRRRRAVALVAIAVIVIGVASLAYLHPNLSPKTTGPAPSSINPLQVTSTPVDYAFVTPSLGWASLISVGPSSEAGQFRVFRTTDGAQHWQQQLVGQSNPDFTPGSYAPISVQLFGKTRGFMAVGGPVAQVYRTVDSGVNWDPVSLPASPRIEEIAFSDPSNGWLLAASISIASQSRTLYATRDGGNNWERLANPPVDAAGLGFRRPTEAWLGSFGPGPPRVYISSDSGQSWRRLELPAPSGRAWVPDRYFPSFPTTIQLLPKVGVIASVESIRCVAVSPSPGGTTCLKATADTFLFMSGDGGSNWKQLPSPPGSVAYQDSSHWWATSTNALFKTTNAGQSWKEVATIPPDRQFSVPGILDSTHGWASVFIMGGYGLALTNDGGLDWTLANVPRPTESAGASG